MLFEHCYYELLLIGTVSELLELIELLLVSAHIFYNPAIKEFLAKVAADISTVPTTVGALFAEIAYTFLNFYKSF